MKFHLMLAAIGLAASPVWAQSQVQSPDQSPGSAGAASPPALQESTSEPAASTMGNQSADEQAGTQQSFGAQSAAEQSEGASAAGTQGAQAESTGQLVTSAMVQSRPGRTTTVAVQPQTANGVTYLCGGIGADEANYMKQTAARDYDLMMTFAARNGNYLADVDVSISDARGNEVLQTTCDGPIMLVDLPRSGNYRVRADAGGQTLDRSVQVRDGRTDTMVFAWPGNVVGVQPQGAGSVGADPGTAGAGAR